MSNSVTRKSIGLVSCCSNVNAKHSCYGDLRSQFAAELGNHLFSHVRALFGFFHIGLQLTCLGQVACGNLLL